MTQPHLFVFGLGYSAQYLAKSLLADGWKISGTVRNLEKAQDLQKMGVTIYPFSTDRPMNNLGNILEDVTHLLSSIPPRNQLHDPVLQCHYDDLKKATDLKWIGYLSTTGVYGDRDGGWVDEMSELLPTGPRGQARVQGEKEWFDLGKESNIPVHSFRLAGIYGPGRSALETVQKGKARRIHKLGQVFSRIHIEDITQILRASMQYPHGGAAYNVCDDYPAPPEEVIRYACDLLQVEYPPLLEFETAELSPMARSFYRDNKRVSNDKIKKELGVQLRWPNYKSAFQAMMAEK